MIKKIYLWIDDIRKPPNLIYYWITSVNKAKNFIIDCENNNKEIRLINMDHDSGDYFTDGGDYIELLNWLEETKRNYHIVLHTMNPVGKINMEAIIRKNNW